MSLTDHGVSLLRQVQQEIRRKPRSFYMLSWRVERWCGSTMCIAGHLLERCGEPISFIGNNSVGAELLGVDYKAAAALFHVDEWPRDLAMREAFHRRRWGHAEEYAEVACERIDRFIAEHRPDLVGASR